MPFSGAVGCTFFGERAACRNLRKRGLDDPARFGVSRRPAIVVILVLGAAYAFVTGLQPPAVRAAIMLGCFSGSSSGGNRGC